MNLIWIHDAPPKSPRPAKPVPSGGAARRECREHYDLCDDITDYLTRTGYAWPPLAGGTYLHRWAWVSKLREGEPGRWESITLAYYFHRDCLADSEARAIEEAQAIEDAHAHWDGREADAEADALYYRLATFWTRVGVAALLLGLAVLAVAHWFGPGIAAWARQRGIG